MKTELLNFLSFLLIVAYVTLFLYFGIYIDLQVIATFVIAAILAPILTYTLIQFANKNISDYLTVPQNFTRTITLQIIDPLLN
jgi:hypothetical protein